MTRKEVTEQENGRLYLLSLPFVEDSHVSNGANMYTDFTDWTGRILSCEAWNNESINIKTMRTSVKVNSEHSILMFRTQTINDRYVLVRDF